MVVLEPGGGVVGGRHVFGNLHRLQVLLAILAEPPTFRFQLAKKKETMRKAIIGVNQSRFLAYFYKNVTVRKSVLGTSRSCLFFSSPKNMTADK